VLGLSADRRGRHALPLTPVTRAGWTDCAKTLGARQRRWAEANGFAGQPGAFCLLPDAQGATARVVCGFDPASPPLALGAFPYRLPGGDYRLDAGALSPHDAALGWALGSYHFARYREPHAEPARLVLPRAVLDDVAPTVEAIARVRDLVNTPAQDMGPAEVCGAVREVAERFGAKCREWSGDGLLEAGFPTVHAVGRASPRASRVIELTWGNPKHPLLALVGKGVCFDTGGLDIKAADGMRNMKKDMGGAAHALALAQLVMALALPIRLTLLVPAVENAIAGNSFRPGEVIVTRQGLSVEVDNTDAEGRLVLCDALAYAAERKPALILDFATLTGAARIALGPDLPMLFCNDEAVAADYLAAGERERDRVWRMPLWRPYLVYLKSTVADLANSGPSRMAGAIVAALYLERFVPETQSWAHLDVYSWNDGERPGKPAGGEAQGLRAALALLQQRFPRT
jgi:leucyl aminopeptidase